MESNQNNGKLKIFHDCFVQSLESAIISQDTLNCYQKRHNYTRQTILLKVGTADWTKKINRSRPTFLTLYKCLKTWFLNKYSKKKTLKPVS